MALSRIEKEALTAFRERLEAALGDVFAGVKLFGSKARGDDKTDSDVDLLVLVSSDDWRLADAVYEVGTDILLDFGVLVSPKVISLGQYEQMMKEKTPFAVNVFRDAVAV